MYGVQLSYMELLHVLPFLYVLFVVALLGLIIGSFLDVVASRFHTGKSLNGRSRCMSCGHTLSWYELFPLVSYLFLRGKCKKCDASIPSRLLLMEICTAGFFVFVFLNATSYPFLFFGLILTSVLIVIALYDIRHMVIPHEFVYVIGVLSLLSIGHEVYLSQTFSAFIPHVLSALCVSLFYFVLWAFSKGRWIGLGDVKLALPLALMLTPYSAFSFVVLSFWIGALISVALLCVQKMLQGGKHRLRILRIPLTIRSEVPFAPFMLLAFGAVFFAQANVFTFMMHLLPL